MVAGLIAALIFVISFAALLEFFVLYCRSILIRAYSRSAEFSDRIREVTGLTSQNVPPSDFERLLQLVRRERGDDRKEIRVIAAYHALLDIVGRMTRSIVPCVAAWTDTERQGCCYFAAVRVSVLVEFDDFKKLQINAVTDALTGLYNRRLFDEYCDKELNRAKRYGHQLAAVILDLRKLKEVNDRHGHLRGDQILQVATKTLLTTLRSSDFAFRIGGDELALLLPQTDSEQSINLCRRVRSQYETEIHALGLDIGVTLDFGIAVYPEDGETKDELMALADKRLYQLKSEGRSEIRGGA